MLKATICCYSAPRVAIDVIQAAGDGCGFDLERPPPAELTIKHYAHKQIGKQTAA